MNRHARINQDFTVAEFCAAFGICRQTAYDLIADGKLRSYKIRRLRRIPHSELEELPKRLLAESEAA